MILIVKKKTRLECSKYGLQKKNKIYRDSPWFKTRGLEIRRTIPIQKLI